MNLELESRRCIITGGSRGIGRATALALAKEGADVALIARSTEALAAVAQEIEELGGRSVPVTADLGNPDELDKGIHRAIAELGGVDVLVNNAGASPMGAFDQITDEDWDQSLQLKLMGYVRCIRAVLPTMRSASYGRIVNVIGAAGRQANPLYVLGSINAALLHLTKTLAEWLASEGITITAINPSATATERIDEAMKRWALAEGEDLDSYRASYLADRLPLGRMAAPEEIAGLIAFLASDRAELLTGSALQADGATTTGVF